MGKHEVPEPYRWSEDFKVFYDSLDDEHKGLFDGIFAVGEDKASQTALDDLCAKVKAHFATEEAMMTKASYDKYEDHKKLHDSFVEELGKVTVPCTDNTLAFAKQWLVDHIKENDFQYKGKL